MSDLANMKANQNKSDNKVVTDDKTSTVALGKKYLPFKCMVFNLCAAGRITLERLTISSTEANKERQKDNNTVSPPEQRSLQVVLNS